MEKLFLNIYSIKQIRNDYYNIFLIAKKSRVFNKYKNMVYEFTKYNNFNEEIIEELRYIIYWGTFKFNSTIELSTLSDIIIDQLHQYNEKHIKLIGVNLNKIYKNREILTLHRKNTYLDIQNTISKILLIMLG